MKERDYPKSLKRDVVKLTKKLIGFNTENSLNGTKKMGNFIANLLADAGFTIMKQRISENKENIIAHAGNPKDSEIFFSSHMDTVPIGKGWTRNPLGESNSKKIYGRGACDMKGPLASTIIAGLSAKKKNFALVFTVDEETTLEGVKKFAPKIKKYLPNVKYGIVCEPNNLGLAIAHKGAIDVEITCYGKSAHSSMPEKGDNAIYNALSVIKKLLLFNKSKNIKIKDKLLGKPTINIGKISGGLATNIVPDKCLVSLDYRLVPPQIPKEIFKDIKKIAKSQGCSAKLNSGYSPHKISKKERIVLIVAKILKDMGMNFKITTAPYYTEAEILTNIGKIPCIILGPGRFSQLHKADEFIEISQLKKAVKVYKKILENF